MRNPDNGYRAAWRPDIYDVVVVGARVAGAATAMLLARAGYAVLMIDRAPAGADTTSTHTILRSGVLQLKRWGLIDCLGEAGAPSIRKVTLGFGADLVPIELSRSFGVDALFAPRRYVLDPLLVAGATEAGVEYVDRCRAKSVIMAGSGRVTGVVVEKDGVEQSIQARFVVGADGTFSKVAGWVGATKYCSFRPENSVYYAYYQGIATDGVYFQFTPGVTAGLIPTNDEMVCVYGGWHVSDNDEFRAHPEETFERRVRGAHPALAEALADGSRIGRFRGTPGLPSFLRQAAGPGWALVGDAGYTKDPVSAHGMSNALRDAELCANAVDIALESPSDELVAMKHYVKTRDRLSRAMLKKSAELASYKWSASRASVLMRDISALIQEECEVIVSGTRAPFASVR